MALSSKNEARKKFIVHTSMPVILVGILGILIFPIPTGLLDIFLALNITISLIVLFVSLYIDKPLRFSSFPAILLITTLFRLAMNVATARLILLNGKDGTDAAGHVIQAFGEFVVGGNFVVGSVIFILISIVNLKVITKGSGRIAEVAARFTLDAMPGKQMAIDSDLSAGMINDKEAKARRKELAMEAEFYGAMDGAAKFVGGDAIAGIFILFINIIGGFLVGCFMQGMDWQQAIKVYIILTIGDGLVSQIPSIIISVSSGLIVARAASGEDLGSDVFGQLGASSKPLYLSSAVALAFAILPGLPFMPFITLSALCGAAAYYKDKFTNEKKVSDDKIEKDLKEDASKPKPGSTEEVTGLLGIDTLELEVGFELVSLVESGDLVERIRSIRRQFALDYGFIVPPIHIRDNVRIKSNEYRFMLKGSVIGSSELKPHHMLAMDPGNVTNPIDGTATKEPSFGLDALWISDSDKERAQFSGYTVVDLPTVITTHLTELVRANMAELLGRQEVQHLIDTVQKDAPKVIEELIPGLLTVGQVQQVLRQLLKEQISIRDLRTILETLADWAPTVKHPEKLAEFVRRRLSRAITTKYLSPEGTLPLASLNPAIERVLGDSVQQTDEGSYLALEPGYAQRLINRLTQISEKFMERGLTPVVLAPGHVRAALAHFIDRFTPGIAVISHQEIAPNTRVQSLGIVALEE